MASQCTRVSQSNCLLDQTYIIIVYNGNCTEWSAIWCEIKRVITKSHDRAAGVRFVITSLISHQNCTTRSHEVLLPLYYTHFEITILKQIRNIYLEKFYYSGSTELYIVLYIIHNILRKVEFGAFLISSPAWLTCLTSII